MFKTDGFEQELLQNMHENMLAKKAEDTHGLSKIVKAVSYLDQAKKILKEASLTNEANELSELIKSFAQEAVMPEYTSLDKSWLQDSKKTLEQWRGEPVYVGEDGKKFIINPGSLTKVLVPTSSHKNKFGLSSQDVERVQLSLNKIIENFNGDKPSKLIPDQKWGELTDKAFSWYDKTTHNAPMQSLKALLDATQKNETASKL